MFPLLAVVAVAVASSLITSYVLYATSKGNSPSVPKLTEDDLSMPTVNEGTIIPVVFGTRDIDSPIVGWYGNLQGDASAGYTLGMHLVLCQGSESEPDGYIRLTRISWGEKCCWLGDLVGGITYENGTIANKNLFENGNGISGSFDFYSGNGTKIFDSYLDSFIDCGTFGWRNYGMASVVFKDINLGSSPSLRNPAFRVQRTLTGWYDAKAEIMPPVVSHAITQYLPGTGTGFTEFKTQVSSVAYANAIVYATPIFLWSDSTNTIQVSGDLHVILRVNGVLIYEDVRPSAHEHSINWEILPKYLKPGVNQIDHTYYSSANSIDVANVPFEFYYEQTVVDMNPIHAIRECLTNTVYGMGYLDTDIDSTSFTACADTLYAEGMGISVKWSKSSTIEDFLKEILRHIDGALFVDRKTGKFKIKLIRKDYELSSLLVFDKTNISSVENWKRTSFNDLHNTVQVTYYNTLLGAASGVTVSDVALVQEQGMKIQTSIDFPAFSNPEIAKKVALRELNVVSNPLLSCTVNTNADALGLDIGDVFLLDWPKYEAGQIPMRIYKMNFGDGTKNLISIDCIEDVTID